MTDRIAIIPGHGWRSRSGAMTLRWDPGAVGVCGQEAAIVRELSGAIVAAGAGRARAFDSAPDGPGTYTDRRTRAHAWIAEGPSRRGVVLHLHLNGAASSGPSYSMAMHDPRSRAGLLAAGMLAEALRRAAVPDVRTVPADRPTWDRAANLVEPTWEAPSGVVAVLLELGFVSSPTCAPLYTPDGLARVARAALEL